MPNSLNTNPLVGMKIMPDKTNQEDMVNEPPHYKQHEMECIDEMVVIFGVSAVIDYCRCAAWKYRYRAPYKGKFEEDNKKADWYLKKAKELEGNGYTTW